MNITIEIQPSFSSWITINLLNPLSKEYIFELSYNENCFKDFSSESSSVINLTKKEWDCITEDLNSKIEIAPNFTMGLDGCIYTVKIENGFNEYKYTLWSPSITESPLCSFINKGETFLLL